MADNDTIKKAESTPKTKVPFSNAREVGQPRIVTSNRFIEDTRVNDLKMTRRLCTFDNMMTDDAVATSVDVTNIHVVSALTKGAFVPKKSQKSKIAADFLNYCIRNMSYGTWMEAMLNASTDLQYGWADLNIVTEKRNYGKYAGTRVLKKLSPRDQKSVYGWLFDKNNQEWLGFVQKPMLKSGKLANLTFKDGLTQLNIPQFEEREYPILRRENLLHFTFNKTNNNPQGKSPLEYCYKAWMEKALIEKLEIVGTSKDLGGAVVLKVPQDLLDRASDPKNYPADADAYKSLQQDAAALQAGEASYIVLSSDVDHDTKQPIYDFKFLGIEGGGKQYKTSDIIDQKRKSIYNVFGAGFLLLGQDSHGSYNLSSTAASTHSFYVERAINQKVDVINNQLAPMLLAVNDIYLDYDDMPEFIPVDPGNELDKDVLSKMIQRMKSVGGLTQEATAHLYEKAGLPTEGIEDLNFDDGDTSRAGESKGSSGTGNTQDGGAASSVNSENGNDMTKSLVLEEIRDDEIVLTDMQTGKTIILDKEG